ncbi:hypothetical protein GCK32_016668 [Trichostrongylus colubriformis]|uniref:SCP domain-containing protein n=1 Tax=Trichostrongylus colubriformis TaxID=6319 RepID=A0AAN8FM71_TRICO
MLLIVGVLAVFLTKTSAQDTNLQIDANTTTILMPELNSTFAKLNEKWGFKPIWDENITREALQEAIHQKSTMADFKILRKRAYMKSLRNETTMDKKVEKALRHRLMIAQTLPHHLPKFSHYGCNGIYNTTGRQDVLTVACLYRNNK